MSGFVRPDAVILGESAIVPEKNLIVPPPNQFTHKLTRSQPFYFNAAQEKTTPSGQLPAGAKVVLLRYDGGSSCYVADEQGLYVEVEYDSLKKL